MKTNENDLNDNNLPNPKEEDDVFVHTRPNSVNKFERKSSQIPTENEINAALNEMISKGTCPPEYMHPHIFTSLNRRRVDAICKSDYDEAEKMDKISEMLTQSIKNSQINTNNQMKGEILYERFCKINENIQEINDRYDRKKEALMSEASKRKQEATDKYNNTEKEIRDKFQNPEYLQKYGKPSYHLSELREQEREYAMQRKYKEAREVKTEADEIERQETEVAQEKISKQETLELEMNYKNYQKELQLIELRLNQQVSLNESDRERELRPLEAALKQIRSKKPSLPPLRPQSHLSEQNQNSSPYVKPSSKMQSPRTQMKLRQMRTEKRVTLLAVKPQPTTKRDQQRLSRLQGTQSRTSNSKSRNKPLKALPPMKGGRSQRSTRSKQEKDTNKAEQQNEQQANEQENQEETPQQQENNDQEHIDENIEQENQQESQQTQQDNPQETSNQENNDLEHNDEENNSEINNPNEQQSTENQQQNDENQNDQITKSHSTTTSQESISNVNHSSTEQLEVGEKQENDQQQNNDHINNESQVEANA